VSVARGLGMCRREVGISFTQHLQIDHQSGFQANYRKIFSMDECGLKMNEEPGKVVGNDGSSHNFRGECGTITLIARSSTEGSPVPSYCIVDGKEEEKKKKKKFEEGLLPGLRVTMTETSAYVTTVMFMDWLRSHFVSREESGSVLPKLDGHTSHCLEVNVLDFATENDVILLCLPSHTTHHLRPLDRFFLEPLKTF